MLQCNLPLVVGIVLSVVLVIVIPVAVIVPNKNSAEKVNGGFSNWSNWTACSVTCGNGTQTQSRTCTNPAPAHGGANCTGLTQNSQSCSTGVKCKVNGGYTNWSNWTACSVTCGNGTQTQSRTCTNPAPAYGGANCTGPTVNSQSCSTDVKCKVNGGLTSWSRWTACIGGCGNGVKYQSRTCTNPAPANGGTNCTGETKKSQFCDTGKYCKYAPNYDLSTGQFNPMLKSSNIHSTFAKLPGAQFALCKGPKDGDWDMKNCVKLSTIYDVKQVHVVTASMYSQLFGITTKNGIMEAGEKMGIMIRFDFKPKKVEILLGRGAKSDDCQVSTKYWAADPNGGDPKVTTTPALFTNGEYHMKINDVFELKKMELVYRLGGYITIEIERKTGKGPCAAVIFSINKEDL